MVVNPKSTLKLCLSETYGIALGAVYAVKVTYSNIQTPLIDLNQAIKQKSFFPKPCEDMIVGKPDGMFCVLYSTG